MPVARQQYGRSLSQRELCQYLDAIVPVIYSETYGMNLNARHQILWALRDELAAWGGLTQAEIDRRVSEGYNHVR
jgi:hypothetical protein